MQVCVGMQWYLCCSRKQWNKDRRVSVERKWIQTDPLNCYESSLVMFTSLSGSKKSFLCCCFFFFFFESDFALCKVSTAAPGTFSNRRCADRRVVDFKRMAQHLVGRLTCYREVIERVRQVGVQRFLFVADERAVCLQQEVARSPVLYVFTCNETQQEERE